MSDGGIKERILEFCTSKQISVRNFEIQCKMSNGYVSSMRKGVGIEKLQNILDAFPELNRDWLLFGEGEMLGCIDLNETISEPADKDQGDKLSRLRQAIQYLFDSRRIFNDADLAKMLGKHRSYISEVLSGKRVLSEKFISEFVTLFDVFSKEWLMTGSGEMIRQSGITPSSDEEIDRLWSLVDSLNQQLKTKDAQINTLLSIIQKLKSE